MSQCREIAVYRIQQEKVEAFLKIKQTLIEEAHLLEGLISSTTHRSVEENNVFVDTMVWESPEHSANAFEHFIKLPTTEKFMAVIDGPPIFHGKFEA